MVKPKKHLGQHFLTDGSVAKRIVSLLPNEPETAILEVGPGKGVLTEYILQKDVKNFVAVDIDHESIQYLRNKYPGSKEKFMFADILKLEGKFFVENNFHVIGNFPYNISSQIFFKILQNKNSVPGVVCMIQKEVAERIASPPGSKRYGILSVLLQAYYNVKIQFHVKAGSFFPAPKVSSSVITFNRNTTAQLNCNENLFFQIVKTTFNQRRKTIRNSLKPFSLDLNREYDILSYRPEQLSVHQFIELTNWVEPKLNSINK